MICDYCANECYRARLVMISGEASLYKCTDCQRNAKPPHEAPSIRIGEYSSPYNRDK